MFLIFLLLLTFQLKHYLADYKWQNEYMLGKFKEEDWVIPLATHCLVHKVITLLITFIVTNDIVLSIGLSWFDFIIHFIMDRIKASPNMLGKYKPISAEKYIRLKRDVVETSKVADKETADQAKDIFEMAMKDNRKFWLSIGIDQAIHHITHYIIIFVMLMEII